MVLNLMDRLIVLPYLGAEPIGPACLAFHADLVSPPVKLGTGMERKLTAILAADVVGYSRLMSADEAGTLAALKEVEATIIEPTVSKFRGRIFKRMGDVYLAEFASASDVVECALAWQDRIAAASNNQL